MKNFAQNVLLMIFVFVMMAFADPADTGAVLGPAAAPAGDISVNTYADTSGGLPAVELLPRPPVNYTGAALSAVIPGAVQIYNGRYVMGAAFIAAEAIAGGMAIYSFDRASKRKAEYDGAVKDYDFALRVLRDGEPYTDNNGMSYLIYNGIPHEDSLVRHWVATDPARIEMMAFEKRVAQFEALNPLAWTVGIYLYNIMDALELGGLKHDGSLKSPTVAGLLAAVPFLGLGQFYNGRPGKAGMMIMAQSGVAVVAGNHHRIMNRAEERYERMLDTSAYSQEVRLEYLGLWSGRQSREFSRRNTYLWTYLVIYIYTIMDAVVDAHLSDYDERMRIGPDLTVGIHGDPKVGMSLTLPFGSWRKP